MAFAGVLHLNAPPGVRAITMDRSLVTFALGASLLVFSGCGPAKQKCDSSTCATGCCDAAGLCQGGATL
jgi:hypothetical protein